MKWIKTHKLISFLIAVILISFFVLIASVASGGKGNIVSNTFNSVFSAIEKPVSSVAGESRRMFPVFSLIASCRQKTKR